MKKSMVMLALLSGVLASCSSAPGTAAPAPADGAGVTATRPTTLIMDDGSRQTVTGIVRDGMLLIEDDIIVSENVGALEGQGTYVVDTRLRWTGNTIPYVFASNVPQAIRDRVRAAASYVGSQTNVDVVPRTNQANYVEFTYNTGTSCASALGKVGGRQTITLADRCSTGSIVHELGHTMGLFHEQTRPDRDRYVSIQWQYIADDWKSQYQIRSGSAGYGSYDYDSIMHYPAYSNGNLVIKPLDPSVDPARMGQRSSYSTTDIRTINAMYPL
ncbi:M12 family metallopeptidase [Deinococcus sp. SL84]|uniref:M12 family metallopeptidase n=1 Tax=Deinococcus sp. SL84 TaxID=2994663 RepID=UPI0022749F20|nr:M12 family metallopeptidase [Deinococcus sp. SL84]MCY1703616.1 M12 family metallopeptidase [Deinococcus sp. SL84]